MKRIAIFLICALATVLAGSCTKTSEGLTRITYYANITIPTGFEAFGNTFSFVNLNDTYTPAFKIDLNGQDVTSEGVYEGVEDVDTSTRGIYFVTCTHTNPDGFSFFADNTVAVAGNIGEIEILDYKAAVTHTNGTAFSDFPAKIMKVGDCFYIDDILGGYYSYGQYPGMSGYDFQVEGFVYNNSGTIEGLYTGTYYWGQGPDITSGTYEDTTGKIELTIGKFTVTFTKK